MILVGIGSNLPATGFASPLQTAAAALEALPTAGVRVARRSRWYQSEPVPPSDQPWYVNAVAIVEAGLPPLRLLEALLALESRFQRHRGAANAARTLDLDLLDHDGLICDGPRLTLPHPRLHQRRFVLAPLAEIAPRWRHPILGAAADALLARLPPGQPVRAIGEPDVLHG